MIVIFVCLALETNKTTVICTDPRLVGTLSFSRRGCLGLNENLLLSFTFSFQIEAKTKQENKATKKPS